MLEEQYNGCFRETEVNICAQHVTVAFFEYFIGLVGLVLFDLCLIFNARNIE